MGSFYIFFGFIFLFIPLVYLEVGRPKDLIKAALNLLIGTILIIKHKVFENLSILICLLLTLLVFLYVAEILSSRWNQLTDKEKNEIKTVGEFKKNLSKVSEAVNLGLSNLTESLSFIKYSRNNENINKKKWVRKGENDSIKTSNKNNLLTLEMPKESTIQSEKDTMNEKKNN